MLSIQKHEIIRLFILYVKLVHGDGKKPNFFASVSMSTHILQSNTFQKKKFFTLGTFQNKLQRPRRASALEDSI